MTSNLISDRPWLNKRRPLGRPLAERFWEKVDTSGECWMWMGCKDKDGYGFIRIDGKNKKAHRVAFELAKGREPSRHTCHTCDTPSCVNPDHLWDGSNAENTLDSCLKERRGSSKLTFEDVRRIREASLYGADALDLASIHGVNRTQIYAIRSKRWWKYVD
jgi:hypothetical protein